jgi:type VI secretion system secreted protein Hcp
MPSGKRQHQPIIFTKEWGAASPQLFQAAATNEILKNVAFDFHQGGNGKPAEIFYTIKLTNASIVSIRQYEDHGKYLEDIALTFAKIEVEHRPSRTTASDDAGK